MEGNCTGCLVAMRNPPAYAATHRFEQHCLGTAGSATSGFQPIVVVLDMALTILASGCSSYSCTKKSLGLHTCMKTVQGSDLVDSYHDWQHQYDFAASPFLLEVRKIEVQLRIFFMLLYVGMGKTQFTPYIKFIKVHQKVFTKPNSCGGH